MHTCMHTHFWAYLSHWIEEHRIMMLRMLGDLKGKHPHPPLQKYCSTHTVPSPFLSVNGFIHVGQSVTLLPPPSDFVPDSWPPPVPR